MTAAAISQVLIAIFGVTAVWLSQDTRIERRKWACIFGLAGQPAWFYAAWQSEQWGIFALCFLYSFSWLRGFVQHWTYRDEYLTELMLGRLSIEWLREPFGGMFRAWKGSNWRYLQIWRIRLSVYWPYERKA